MRAMRYCLGMHNLTPLPSLYGEMGWLKTKYRHYIHVIRFWNRLVNMDNHRLTKHIFQSDALFSVTGKRNCSYDVNSCGYPKMHLQTLLRVIFQM